MLKIHHVSANSQRGGNLFTASNHVIHYIETPDPHLPTVQGEEGNFYYMH